MRVLDGEQLLVRVFIGEWDKWHHQPLHVALLTRLREEGFAGATVFHRVAGFGARSIRSARAGATAGSRAPDRARLGRPPVEAPACSSAALRSPPR